VFSSVASAQIVIHAVTAATSVDELMPAAVGV
jgi:hypothetical protein